MKFKKIELNTPGANGPFFIKTETDPTGGTTYTITGISKLLSVPYAKYADKAGNTFSGIYSDLIGVPQNIDTNYTDDFDGDYNNLTNLPTPAVWDSSYSSLQNTPPKSISLNLYGVEISDGSTRGNYGEIILPEIELTPSFASHFVLPADYSAGTNITIRFILKTDEIADVSFRNNFVRVFSAGASNIGWLDLMLSNTTYVTTTDFFEVTTTLSDATALLPGDAISFGVFRFPSAIMDVSTSDLFVYGIQVLYE